MIEDSMRPNFCVKPISEQTFLLLGLVSASWSEYELVIEFALHKAGIAELTALNAPRDISTKLKNLRTHAETKVADKALRKQLLNACEQGLDVCTRRNLAIHGKWAYNKDTDSFAAVSYFQLKDGEPLKMLHEKDLPQLAKDIPELTRATQKALEPLGLFFAA